MYGDRRRIVLRRQRGTTATRFARPRRAAKLQRRFAAGRRRGAVRREGGPSDNHCYRDAHRHRTLSERSSPRFYTYGEAQRVPDQSRMPPRTAGNGRGPGIAKGGPVVIIDAEQSATIRDRLLADIGNIASAELAASWAGGARAAKHQLPAVAAEPVDDAFDH